MDVKVFNLPKGIAGWPGVQERVAWCRQQFGERTFAGPWEYHAVSHVMILREKENIMLYALRWGV